VKAISLVRLWREFACFLGGRHNICGGGESVGGGAVLVLVVPLCLLLFYLLAVVARVFSILMEMAAFVLAFSHEVRVLAWRIPVLVS